MEHATKNTRGHTTKLAMGFLHMVVEGYRQPHARIRRIGDSLLGDGIVTNTIIGGRNTTTINVHLPLPQLRDIQGTRYGLSSRVHVSSGCWTRPSITKVALQDDFGVTSRSRRRRPITSTCLAVASASSTHQHHHHHHGSHTNNESRNPLRWVRNLSRSIRSKVTNNNNNFQISNSNNNSIVLSQNKRDFTLNQKT